MSITLSTDTKAILVAQYEQYHVIYETTRNPKDRAKAATKMLGLRSAFGLSHNAILALADQLP